MKEENEKLQEETKAAIQTAKRLRSENDTMKTMNAELQSRVEQLSQKLKKEEDSSEKLKLALLESNRTLKEIKSEEKGLKKEISELRTELIDVKRNPMWAKNQDQALKEQLAALAKMHAETIREADKKLLAAYDDYDKLQEMHRKEMALIHERKQDPVAAKEKAEELVALAEENKRLVERIEELQKAKTKLEVENAELLVDVELTNEELDVLRQFKQHECALIDHPRSTQLWMMMILFSFIRC